MTIYYEPPATPVSPNLLVLGAIAVAGSFELQPTTVLGIPVMAVSYTQASAGFGQDRIAALARLPNQVVLSSVNSTYVLANGSPITNHGAAMHVNGDVQIIIWDQQNCGGMGYFFCNRAGEPIPAPAAIIVAHELAHAFHTAIGDAPANTHLNEAQASADENQHRLQLGLPERDPGNHRGGCGAGTSAACESGCFIVSAAYGSATSPQVQRLLGLRDASLRGSVLGQLIFEYFSAEYYQVSPQIAADMRQSAALGRLLSLLIVEPIVAFFAAADSYLHDDRDEHADEDVKRILGTSRAWLGERSAQRLRLVGDLVRTFSHRSGGVSLEQVRLEPPDDAWIKQVSAALDYVRAVIERSVGGTSYLSWALFGPVDLYWSFMATSHAPPGADLRAQMRLALEEWFAAAPLPPEYAEFDEDIVHSDLEALSEQITPSSLRKRIGQRLLAAYGASVRYDLQGTLVQRGFAPEAPHGR